MTATEPEEPKPCKWCHSPGVVQRSKSGGEWWCGCSNKNCPIGTTLAYSKEDAVQKWNARMMQQ